MVHLARRFYPAAGLLVAIFATAVAVRAWQAERYFQAGTAAQRRGEFNAAAAAYREASGRGSADAAIERARLELLRREWDAAGASLREAAALAPTRGFPHLLRATLEISRPGAWDAAREERVLAAARAAAAVQPGRGENWYESAGTLLKLAALRGAVWDPVRTRAVHSEAAAGFAEALARDPGAARDVLTRVLAGRADPAFLLEVAARREAAAGPQDQVALEVLPLYRAAVAAAPGDAAVRLRFAGFLAAQQRFGEAEGEARAVVGAAPEHAEAWFLLGEILNRRNRTGEAGVAYRAAAELRPDNTDYRLAADGLRR